MTDWHDKVAEQTLLLTRLGATDADLAKFFNVEERTIHNWKHAHPEFLDAIIEGKDVSDAKVAHSLYRRALGYSHEAVKIVADAKTGDVLQVPYTEHYPPDTTAAIFWLKNRQSAKWRDRVEHTGAEGGPIVIHWESPGDAAKAAALPLVIEHAVTEAEDGLDDGLGRASLDNALK